MKIVGFIIFFAFSLSTLSHGQTTALTPTERAYLFHIVKKSPILEMHIGRYFEYTGDEVKFANGKINYDSIESNIINDPSTLVIYEHEIAKSTKGILAEAANKTAIWELNKMLLAKRSKDEVFETFRNRYVRFEQLLMEHLPSSVLNDEKTAPHTRFDNVLNPSMSLDDKVAQLASFRNMTTEEELLVIDAISKAVNSYVEERTKEIFVYLGGEYTKFNNILVAAGDGSITSGLLDEREKDEKGRWNKGLPKAIGLFPYQTYISTPTNKKEKPKVEPMRVATIDLHTVGENRNTNLHFDVWGYNAEKQTTVVIEKHGKVYHLFGSGETRFLSPDSTFGSGATYQSIINKLEFVIIADLTEKIEGKRGFDYWIAYYKDKKEETELAIIKNEKNFSDLNRKPITTSDKASKQVKKSKKNAVKAGVGADNWKAAPTTNAGKKQKGSSQHSIVNLYGDFEAIKTKIKELEKEKQEAVDLRARYQLKLDEFKRNMGTSWMPFTVKDGLYTYSDSSTFDMYTQEFTFPATKDPEAFEIRLIAIPGSPLAKDADEVMLHVSLVDSKPNYDARVQIDLQDVFASNEYAYTGTLITPKDSIAIRQFFEALLDKDKDFTIIARGQGVGKWNDVQVVKDYQATEQNGYESIGRDNEIYARLRKSELQINIERDIILEVNSFTDPVKTNFTSPSAAVEATKKAVKATSNDVLSAHRTATILRKFRDEISVLAGTYMKREEAKIIIDKISRAIEKTKVSIGMGSVKIQDL